MNAGEVTRWAVVHRVRAAGRSRSIARLVVDDVPASVSRAVVVGALEAAGCAAQYSEGGVPWANHVVLPERRWPAFGWEGRIAEWTWDNLVAAQKGRTLFLDLPPSAHARVQLAAGRAGVSMRAWALRVLLAALDADEVAS